MSSSSHRPIGVLALVLALATPVACGSSDDDGPQSLAGAAGMGGGGAGKSGAGSGGLDDAAGAAGSSDAAGASGEAGSTGGTSGAGGTAGSEPNVAGSAGQGESEPQMLALSGSITFVHDPAIVKDGDTYYLFSTGQGVQIRTSKNLKSWASAGQVFASKPSWITTTAPSEPNNLWAPEVLYFGGTFHLYYAASKFGSNESCIGHATKASLGSSTPWKDLGALLCSNLGAEEDDFNAIDASPFVDETGNSWLSFGSFWGGLKLRRIDLDGRLDGPDFFSIATRANKAIEAPHMVYHDGYYFLFESVDSCCNGVNSTYKIMVGRSTNVSGPYLDQTGTELAAGGGTLVLEGFGRWRGPGHNAIVHDGERYYNVYHSYDAENGGVPTLRIAELAWSDDNWPVSAGP